MTCDTCHHARGWHDDAGCQWLTFATRVRGCPCIAFTPED